MNKEIISLTRSIVKDVYPLEMEIFDLTSEEILRDIQHSNGSMLRVAESGFGEAADSNTTILMIIIASAAIQLGKEGVSFSKHALHHWLKKNSKKILKNSKNKYIKGVVEVLDNYLAKSK